MSRSAGLLAPKHEVASQTTSVKHGIPGAKKLTEPLEPVCHLQSCSSTH
jgi:hypothetical protein